MYLAPVSASHLLIQATLYLLQIRNIVCSMFRQLVENIVMITNGSSAELKNEIVLPWSYLI